MKRYSIIHVLFFTFVFITCKSYALSYSNHGINSVAMYWNCQNFHGEFFPFALYCTGDTICNGLKYERLYYLNIPMPPNEIGMELIWDWQNLMRDQYKQHIGELRYSDDNEKIYVRQNDTEYLLFDFSVKEGDVCRVYAGFDTVIQPKQTEFADSIIDLVVLKTYEQDGKRVIDLAETSHPNDTKYQTTWIEGVGSIYGLFPILIEDVPSDIPASSLLLCAWHVNDNVGELVYHTPDDNFAFLSPSAPLDVVNTCASITILDGPTDVTDSNDAPILLDYTQPMINIWGFLVDIHYRGIVIQNCHKFLNR